MSLEGGMASRNRPFEGASRHLRVKHGECEGHGFPQNKKYRCAMLSTSAGSQVSNAPSAVTS